MKFGVETLVLGITTVGVDLTQAVDRRQVLWVELQRRFKLDERLVEQTLTLVAEFKQGALVERVAELVADAVVLREVEATPFGLGEAAAQDLA